MIRSSRHRLSKVQPPSGAPNSSMGIEPVRWVDRVRWDVALLIFLPVGLLTVNQEWIFSGNFRDPWIYFGFFKNAPDLLAAFSDEYYSSRLSVILPGFVLHQFLDAAAATVALHLLLYWTSVFAFFDVSSRLLGRAAGLLSTVLLGSHPFFLWAIGSNYVDGFGITFFLLAIAFLFRAARTRLSSTLRLLVVGACAAALIVANLTFAVLVPLIVVSAWPLLRRQSGSSILRAAFVAAAGFGAALLVMGVSGGLLGGPFLFLWSSVRWAIGLGRESGPPLTLPMAGWLPSAGWVVFPAMVLVGAAISIGRTLRSSRDRKSRRLLPIHLSLVAGVLGFVVMQAVKTPYLEWWFYCSLLLPVGFLSLGAQLREALPEMGTTRTVLLAFAVALLQTVGYGFPPADRLLSLPGLASAPAVLVPLFVGLLGIVALHVRGRRLAALAIAIGAIVASQSAAARLFPSSEKFSVYDFDKIGVLRQIDSSLSVIGSVASPAHVHPWYSKAERSSPVYDLIAATMLSNYRFVSEDFPDPGSGFTRDASIVKDGTRIVVLSERKDALALARSSMAKRGFRLKLLREEEIEGPSGRFEVIVLEVRECQ